MTIKECIDIVDNLKPNQYSIYDKVDWLSYLDHSIINEVLLTHEGYDGRYDDFTGYSPDKLEVGLIVQSPYDRLYPAYIKMKIDEENGETARYNNSVTLFNAYLMEYKKWYNSNHMPLASTGRRSIPAPVKVSAPSGFTNGKSYTTLKECIDTVDAVKPNQYSIEDKVAWLSFLDHSIINEVILTHEGYDGRYDGFTGYSADKLEVALVVPSPYDRLYGAYLKMKIDEENGETARYNNSATLFNAYLMEFKKWYNSNNMPMSSSGRPSAPMMPSVMDVTEAQMEQLKKVLFAELEDIVRKSLSDDKIQDIVKRFMDTNAQMLKGKDGRDGVDGNDGYTPVKGVDYFDGKNGRDGSDGKDGIDGKDYVLTQDDKREIANMVDVGDVVSTPAKISTVTLFSGSWVGDKSPYSQVVSIEGATKNSRIDLNPSVEQLAIFYEKDLAFVTENENGIITVYAIGQMPQNNYTMQVTITEVDYE